MKKWIFQRVIGTGESLYKCPDCGAYLLRAPKMPKINCVCGFHEGLEPEGYVRVAWQREANFGGGLTWVHVHEDDIEHYRSKGQRIRALYVKKEDL